MARPAPKAALQIVVPVGASITLPSGQILLCGRKVSVGMFDIFEFGDGETGERFANARVHAAGSKFSRGFIQRRDGAFYGVLIRAHSRIT